MLIHKKIVLLLSMVSIGTVTLIPNVEASELVPSELFVEIHLTPRSRNPFVNIEDSGGTTFRQLQLSLFTNYRGETASTLKAGDYYYKGWKLSRHRAINSGAGTHGGSYWKLFDRHQKRIGTYDKHGREIRP